MAIPVLMIMPMLAAPMLRITQRFCIVTDLKRGFRTVATATVMRAGCDKKEGRGPVEPPSDPAHTDNTQQADRSDDWNWYWWCVSDHDKAMRSAVQPIRCQASLHISSICRPGNAVLTFSRLSIVASGDTRSTCEFAPLT